MLFYNIVKLIERISEKIGFVGDLYLTLYQRSVAQEAKLASITKADKILHIGCGSLPYTAEVMAQTGAKVIAIDNDPEAVKAATIYVAKKNLNFEIFLGNGEDYQIEDFTVIVLSLGVQPLEPIIQRILCQARKGTRVVFRVSQWLGRFYANQSFPSFLVDQKEHYKKIQMVNHSKINLKDSVIIEL